MMVQLPAENILNQKYFSVISCYLHYSSVTLYFASA